MKNRIPVTVFLPVGVCYCTVAEFLGNVQKVIMRYKDEVEYREEMAISRRAKELGVESKGILIGSHYFEGNVSVSTIEDQILKEMSQSH